MELLSLIILVVAFLVVVFVDTVKKRATYLQKNS